MLNSKKINFIRLREKKREYYRRSREAQGHTVKDKSQVETIYGNVDYKKEFTKDNILDSLKDIARKQKDYIESREQRIRKKVEEYRAQKRAYYRDNIKNSDSNNQEEE
jgi:hypothetical protein